MRGRTTEERSNVNANNVEACEFQSTIMVLEEVDKKNDKREIDRQSTIIRLFAEGLRMHVDKKRS
jgi:hypothetical protein